MDKQLAVDSELVDFVCDDGQTFHNSNRRAAANVLKFLAGDLTVPFIARYRKEETGGMDVERIRQIQTSYENYQKLQSKVSSVIKKVGSDASTKFLECLRKVKSVDEVQELYAPFKKGGEGTLAERARKLGLGDIASEILKTPGFDYKMDLKINRNIAGLKTVEEIKTGVQCVLADLIAKNLRVQEEIKTRIERKDVQMVTKAKTTTHEIDQNEKFALYYKFNCCCEFLKSYQVLAINRAESLKIITVKLEVNSYAKQRCLQWLNSIWLPSIATGRNRKLLTVAVEDSFSRLIEKSYLRRLRTKLSKEAELEAITTFSQNLKQLLLVAPLKNENVLSIDPGFRNGCKIAVIDNNGSLLNTSIIYPFQSSHSKELARNVLRRLVQDHSTRVIALGNGCACRETECLISEMIKNEDFKPLDVRYSIVDESGASIYSVTKEAKDEFGSLDPNLISAVSIGRRLQDPLLEFVKIEAKHLGVGMYQHDINDTLLKAATNAVIEDCVSFVGVDLNACSVHILKRLAGVSIKQAEAIIHYRENNGDFICRKELERVKGIGKVTYRNIAGFVRIIPKRDSPNIKNENIEIECYATHSSERKRKLTSKVQSGASKKKKQKETELKTEILDRTCIHPESYHIASKVLDHLKVTSEMIGTEEIKKKIADIYYADNYLGLVKQLSTDTETLRLVLDGLQQTIDFDLRTDFERPVFKTGLTSIHHLKDKEKITGVVRNTTSFGVFVDIGITSDGLIYSKNSHRGISLGPADRIECEVINIDVKKKRIGLRFVQKLSKDVVLK